MIAFGEVLLLGLAEVFIGRREAVGAVLLGCATKALKRLLETFGQGRVGLATEDDFEEAPATVGQPEVVEAMVQPFSGNGDFNIAQLGEVREPQSARLLALPEHDLLVGAVERLPGFYPTLEGPFVLVEEAPRMAILEILE